MLPAAFHFAVGVKKTNASKHTYYRLVRDRFPEFVGAQCDVKARKGWGKIRGR